VHHPLRGLLGVHSRFGLLTRAAKNSWLAYPGSFSLFVTSQTAPVASGWSVRRAGLYTLKSAAFGRRTPEAGFSALQQAAASFIAIAAMEVAPTSQGPVRVPVNPAAAEGQRALG
jgi:hypothetical protein